MSWSIILLIIGLTSLLWFLAGFLLLFAAGVQRRLTFLCSPLVSAAALGLFTLFGPIIPFNGFSVLIGFVFLLICVLGLRFLIQRHSFKESLKNQARLLFAPLSKLNKKKCGAIILGLLLNCGVMYYFYISPVASPDALLMNYDNPFHMSVVRHILETQNASPIGAGSVMGNDTAIYPSLWHGLVSLTCQVFNLSIENSIWVVCFALLMFIAPVGMVALCESLVKPLQPYTVVLACIASTLLPTSIAMFAFNFGMLFANLIGIILVPYGVAAIVWVFNKKHTSAVVLHRIAWIIISAIATGLAQPNSFILMAVILLPFFVTWVNKWWQRWVLVIGFSALWMAFLQSPAFSRTVNCLDRVSTSAKSGNNLISAAGLNYDSVAQSPIMVAGLCLLPLVVAIIIAFFLRKKWQGSWYLASLGAIFALFLFSAFPTNPISVIFVGYWYRDFVRFLVMLTYFAIPILVFVPQAAVQLEKRIPNIALRNTSFAVTTLIVLAICTFFVVRPSGLFPQSFRSYQDILSRVDLQDELSVDQRQFSKEVAEIVGDAKVLNNFNDGSVWLYPVFGVDALIKGHPANQMSSMDDNLCTLIEGIDRIGEDSSTGESIRNAAEELDVEYVVKMSDVPNATTRFTDDSRINYAGAPAITNVNENTPGLELVIEDNGMQLFRINH